MVPSPGAKGELGHQLGLDPVDSFARIFETPEGRTLLFYSLEALPKGCQHLVTEPSAYSAGIDQVARAVVIPDKQGAKASPRPSRIGEAADNKLVLLQAFDLEPVVSSSRTIGSVPRFETMPSRPILQPC